MNTPKPNGHKRQAALLIGGAIIIGAAILGWYILRQGARNPLSENTVIGANVVNVSSAVPGRIVSINVKENSAVRRGEVKLCSPSTRIYTVCG